MNILKILLIFSLLIVFSCKDQDDVLRDSFPSETNFTNNFGEEITRNFFGEIKDINNNPIPNVVVTIGNSSTETDENGFFIINSAIVNKQFAYIRAKKTGYINGSRSLIPTNGINRVTIMLLVDLSTQTINSNSVITINTSNGASVTLPGNYITDNGDSYTGNIDVVMHYIDPVDQYSNSQMPGMLYAENTNGDAQYLQSFGMLSINLKGENDEILNLAPGSTAELKIPVNENIINNAPPTIPLWYFNETKGYWIEEGEAILVDNSYKGIVSHFTVWNADEPTDSTSVCLTIYDETENPLSNLNIIISSSAYGSTYGTTNELGEFCGIFPSDENFELIVYDNNYNTDNGICYNYNLLNSSIGPFNGNDNKIEFVIPDNSEIIYETVTGILSDCDGNPTNGYFQITYNGETNTIPVINGGYEITIPTCNLNRNFILEAYNIESFNTTGEISYTFTTPETFVGNLLACNSIDEFITYQVNDYPPITRYGNFYTEDSTSNLNFLWFTINGPQFNINLSSIPEIGIDNSIYQLGFWDENGNSCGADALYEAAVNISAAADIGDYIDATFSATYYDTGTNEISNVNGVIHVIRTPE